MTKTSHKKNRPFDFKLIDLVEPHAVLYQRQMGLSTYESMKAKNQIWKEIAREMESTVEFCIMRWGNLRGQYQKELRHCRELCPKQGIIRGSRWPYLERLNFLENTVQFNRPKRVRVSKREEKRRRMQQKPGQQEINCQSDWEEYLTETEHNSEGETMITDIVDEIFEDSESYSMVEEIPAEQIEEHVIVEEKHIIETEEEVIEQASSANLQRMATLLVGIEGENKARVERRIMAFLCKCQLRALSNEGVDDLVI